MRGLCAALALVGLAGAGCGGVVDLDALEARHPALAGIASHRLGDVTPYLLPAGGQLVYFLCRWPDGARIPVDLPPDADDGERRDIQNVLRAWEAAGLGVHFGAAEPGRGIEIRYAEDQFPESPRAATAVADCRVDPAALEAPGGELLSAEIVFASIHLSRSGRDKVGRTVPWARDERVGALLHEMGHALGFQGHALRNSVMVASVDAVRAAGRRQMAGQPLRDDTLRALYALPSGVVLARAEIGAQRTAAVDRMLPLARRRGLRGPFAQVGDRAARIVWRDAHRTSYALTIWNPKEVLRRPGSLALYPEPRAADLLRRESGSRSPTSRSTTLSRCAAFASDGSSAAARSRCSRARCGSEGSFL